MVIEAYQYLTDINIQHNNTETINPPIIPLAGSRKRSIPPECNEGPHRTKTSRPEKVESNEVDDEIEEVKNHPVHDTDDISDNNEFPITSISTDLTDNLNSDIAIIDTGEAEKIENGNETFEVDFSSTMEIEQIETIDVKQVNFCLSKTTMDK